MDQTLKGIIIHTIRYNDTQVITRIFTSKFGLKSFIMRSGKGPKSGKLNLLQPLSLVEFESSLKESTKLNGIKNLRTAHPWQSIPFDPAKSSIVLFLNEVLYKTIPDDYINEPMFRFIWNSMILLDDAIHEKNFHLWCLLEISRHYGFYPQREDEPMNLFDMQQGYFVASKPSHTDYMNEEISLVLLQMIDREWPEIQDLAFSGTLRKQLLANMIRYIRIHLETLREIKSLDVLHAVFHDE